MSAKWPGLVGVLVMFAATATAAPDASTKILRVYGPGGPHHVLEECADLFLARHGVDVTITRTLPHELEQRLREDGDIYYGGAEYMLDEFDRSHPGVLDMTSAEKLRPRRIGIVVRKGNPLDINGIEDLRRQEVDLLDVKLENMRQLHGALPGKSGDVRRFVYTGQEGVGAWLSTPEIDAWVTYKSWHVVLEKESDFIEISGDHALRFTPMALTQRTLLRQEAMNFINFLKSGEANQIFREHGWD